MQISAGGTLQSVRVCARWYVRPCLCCVGGIGLAAPLVSAEESCGVVLQRATDKLIHLLTLLTRPSDFVKLTID